ncbi:hypothetical protein [Roseateles sp. BYS96W]|uniref:Uncharacterized protein n=1 Tax=Pelomonas nitida TaxID=3299027 RepID=A0ABW7G522_9BURK
MRDLMVAQTLLQVPGFVSAPANPRMSGATDANHGCTPYKHASHDLGMAMDLGISECISGVGQNQYIALANVRQEVRNVSPGNGPGVWTNELAAKFMAQFVDDANNRQDRDFSAFASMYAALIAGANGSRDTLANSIAGAKGDTRTAILNALFGSGRQALSIVSGVLIDGAGTAKNSYPDGNCALTHLGFVNQVVLANGARPIVRPESFHNNHFHIYFQPPQIRRLSDHLIAAADPVYPVDAALVQLTSKPISPAIVNKIDSELSNLCYEVENPHSPKRINSPGSASNYMDPAVAVIGVLKYKYGIEPEGRVSTVVLSAPAHGKIVDDIWVNNGKQFPLASYQLFKYLPEGNFYGADRVKFEVVANGKTFRVSLKINVIETSMDGDSCQQSGDIGGRAETQLARAAAGIDVALAGIEEVMPGLDYASVQEWLGLADLIPAAAMQSAKVRIAQLSLR